MGKKLLTGNMHYHRRMLPKKILAGIFFLVFTIQIQAQKQQPPGKQQMEPGTYNLKSFSKQEKASNLEQWKKLNNPKDEKHPEFGILPKDAPCQDCIEIYKKRTRDERYFIDSKDHTKYFKQQALGNLSYEKKGQWLTIDHGLKPKSATAYESGYEHEPAGFEISQKQGYIKTVKGKVAFNNWTLWSRTAGTQTKLANADWSNYTIGDDGVYIKNVFQDIDAQMIVYRGAIKTNFIMKRNSYGRFDELIFKDSFSGIPGINVSFTDNASLSEGNGEISINATAGELLKMNSAVAYAQGADKDKMIEPSYLLEGLTVGMVIPYKWINENIANYELIIDPLVTASNTLALAAITGSSYSATCFTNYCTYNLSVSQPANSSVTDIRWTFNYIAQGICWTQDGAVTFRMNSCNSPATPAFYWFCNGIGAGPCNGNNISIFSDLMSCLPAPSCSAQNLGFEMRFYRCFNSASGCSNSCIGAGSPWIMTIEGRTTEFSNPTNAITLSNTTTCQGGSLTASTTGLYGRPPYNYSWSFNASGTPVIATGATATINFPAAGNVTLYSFITDSCGNIISANRTITVTPSVSPSVSITATPSGTICPGTSVTFTANHTNGGSSPAFQWRKNGNPVGTNNASYTDATLSNGDIITVTLTSNNACASPSSATSANYVVQSDPVNAVAQNITVQLDASGNATITPTQINNGSSSGCGISIMSIDVANFNCSNIGPNTVTLSVTDNAGNTDSATATVIVEDNIAPNAVAQNINVVLDASGNATITAAQINNGSSDNCAIASMTIDKTIFRCSDTGPNTVTLTVTDTSGNTDTATSTVTIQNNILPTAVTQNITVQLDASGNATITPTQIDNGSTGNCSFTLSLDITSFNCSNVGANTVTLTVIDTSGNTNSATAIVTVEDSIVPNAVAQNITVQLNASGNATITPAQINNGSSDNCSITLSLDTTVFSCADIGTNTVILTASDTSGNTDTATATVIVEDNIAPNAVAQNINVVLDASGNATITPAQIDNGSSDNCAIASMTIDKTTFSCSDTGSNTVTLTVTDTSGNTDTATATVTIQNNILPTAVTQNITVQLDASGNATITPTQIDNGSTGNCSFTLSLDITSFNCSNVGANTVTLTVTDTSGNTSSATAVVNVEDSIVPNAIAQNIIVQLDASGNATITPAQIDNGSSDNCSIASMSLDILSFNCSNIGTNTVNMTVTDASGSSDTATAIITVEDNTAPSAITQNITVQLDASGNATITPMQIDNGSNDNCAITSMTLDNSNFNCSNIGTNTVTLTVTDTSGNADTATAIVTVEDNIAPNAIVQNITVQLDASGNATITPTQIDNGSSDNCSITLSLDTAAFNCSDIGANTVTLTVTDTSGNTDTATAIVTVEDSIVPNAIAQNITVQLDASGNATITPAQIDNGSSDNCSITLSLDITSFNCSNVGANTVTLTVTDTSGNADTATAIVTVEDSIVPNAIAQNIIVQLDDSGNATITPAQIDNGSSDNCTIASMTLDNLSFNCSNLGANAVVLTVIDSSGNADTATATVTVEDNIFPNAIAQNITVQLDASGNATITPAQIDNGSSDNCSIASMTLDNSSFNCSNIGANNVTLTVTDSSGNTDTATATVTVEDNIAPNAIAQNITVQLDASGNATITPAQIDNGSSDNCSIASMALDILNFNCSNIGTNTVTLTVTDTSGNTDTATATVTVEDNIFPNAITQNITVQLDASGNATITPAQIDNGSSDNCAIASMTLDNLSFNCSDLGVNNVVLTVIDSSGNTDTATAIVTVEDNTFPNAIAQNITIQLNASGNATITPAQIDNGSSDNCSIASMTLDNLSFNCSNIGTNTVTLTVADSSGNTDTATATVTVEDILTPSINVIPTTIYLDALGQATLTFSDIDNGTTDNCGIQNITLGKTAFNCDDIGSNTVSITANDINGNTNTSTVVINVADILAPIAITQNIQVSLDTNGFARLTPQMINDNSTDNCSIESMSLDITTLSCANIGPNTITLTVIDLAGNTDSATAIVTVLPIPEPIAVSTTQSFCVIDIPRVHDIEMTSSHIVWYANSTTTNTLSSNAYLSTGTYYAATRYGNCYSTRLAVNVVVNDPPPPTATAIQYFCKEEPSSVADLQADQQAVNWYDVSSGGIPLDFSEALETQTYYASFLDLGCESSVRLAIDVVVRNCDVKVFNAISSNNDGKNDFLLIEGVESFPDNRLEIFNRWGVPVYEVSQYGQNGNLFKGISNTGLASKDTGTLPFGTYYYVFSFTNYDGQRIIKNGFIHLNN